MSYQLEIIGFTLPACMMAQNAGAHRIELCAAPKEGGTTPPLSFIKAARKALQIELYTMIRPRGGDFLYDKNEFEMMKADIITCKQLGCDGVVLGVLNADGSIDKIKTQQLVELAYPMGVTFHRAFDRCNDPFTALEDIIDCGCERILTSGLQPTAAAGSSLIKELIQKAASRISIMPGSGIRSNNIEALALQTGASEFHSSATRWTGSSMQYINTQMNEQLQNITADEHEIIDMIAVLNKLSGH